MANIRNSISLQDHMTPVFRSIMKSMDSTLRLMRQLDKASNNGAQSKAYNSAAKDIQRANNALIKMQNNLKRCDSQAASLKKTASGIGSAFSSFNLTNIASGLYLIKNALNAISNTMATPDNLIQGQYRLQQYDTTSATGSQLYNSAYKTALDSRSDVDSTASLASRILVSGATKGNGGAAIQMAGILNKASLIGGSTQEESKRALLQLSQGLSSGVLQGDELRAIREQAPGLTDTLAKGLSSLAERGALPDKFLNTTIGDLKELGGEGELTADRIIAAFSEMEDYINETFEKSPKTFGQAMTGITNVWKNFLKQMGEGDNALARLTDKAWELYEFLVSDAGTEFFHDLGTGINIAVSGIMWLIDSVGNLISWFNSLSNSGDILRAELIGIGVAALFAAISSIVAFVSANWVILLVIASVALLAYAFMAMGATVGQAIGYIAAFILALVALIWDVLVAIVVGVLDILTIIITAVILVIQGIVQVILWLITTIYAILLTLANIWNTLWNGFQVVVKGVVIGIVKLFAGMANKVLGIIHKIASAIDAVFGSNLAGAVGGWMSGIDGAVSDLETTLNIKGDLQDISGGWSDMGSTLGDMYAGKGKYDAWNITDNMADVWNGAGDIYSGINDIGGNLLLDVGGAWDTGIKFGDGIDSALSNLSFDPGDGSDLGDLSGMLDSIAGNGVGVDGGNLDSVGKINSDVDISDEDIQLLKDIAARDFLVNIQTVTPKASIRFGDVRETADVNKIIEVIEDMVEEQLATALVVE